MPTSSLPSLSPVSHVSSQNALHSQQTTSVYLKSKNRLVKTEKTRPTGVIHRADQEGRRGAQGRRILFFALPLNPRPWTLRMPQDDKSVQKHETRSNFSNTSPQSSNHQSRPWFNTPAPIKRLFARFPLQTYSSNELPLPTVIDRSQNNLYIFSSDDGSQHGAPSCNPSCLKWQVRREPVKPTELSN